MNLKKKTFFAALFAFFVAVTIIYTPTAQTKITKEYQQGQFVEIGGQNFLIASNKQFIEIIEISKNDELKQISEVHGIENVNDLGVMEIANKSYLFVLTGRYIIKYDISNPYMPVVDLKRDLYDWRTGKYAIGYMLSMSFSDSYIFTAGEKGVRRFNPDNLFVDKIYYFDNARSVASNNNVLAVLTPDKGLVYNIEGGNLIKEVMLENKDDMYMREPLVDVNANVYFPSDNALFRVDGISKELSVYNNPVEPGVNHSYAVNLLNSDEIFYANGFGLTKLNSNLKKASFFHGSNYNNGKNSWTMGVDTSYIAGEKRVVVFNNSSIILLNSDMSVLDRYRYTPATISDITTPTELGLVTQKNLAFEGDVMQISLYGFWPNESVSVGFYEARERVAVKTDNRGFGRIDILVSDLEPGWQIISAIGNESKLSFQKTFEMR